MFRYLLTIIILTVTISGCVTAKDIPVEQYVLAKAAYDAAVAAEASKYSAQQLYAAEKHYKRGEVLFKERYYNDASKEFIKAQKLAEKAESTARLKQFQAVGNADY